MEGTNMRLIRTRRTQANTPTPEPVAAPKAKPAKKTSKTKK